MPGLGNLLRALQEAGGNRTRRERDGTETRLIRSVERVNLLLERWHAMYCEQRDKNQPRLALINALELCAEAGVPLPDWVAWDIRDAANSLLLNGVPLNESLHVERFEKNAKTQTRLLHEQQAMRLRFEVLSLLDSGDCKHKTEALNALSNTAEFPHSASTLSRMLKLSNKGVALNQRVLKGMVTRTHTL